MKVKNAIILVVLLALICLSAYTAIYGLQFGDFSVSPLADSIKLGLDLKGGVFVVYEVTTQEEGLNLDRMIDQTIAIFQRRIDALAMGTTEPVIVREGDKRIRVELPGLENAQEAIDLIGKTAQLRFVTADDGEVVLTGANVRNAEVGFQDGFPVVNLTFDSEGERIFAEVTTRLMDQYPLSPQDRIIYIFLDEDLISFPQVQGRITSGVTTISGRFTLESASTLASLIRGGALPVDLEEVQSSTVTATLGVNALNRSIQAAKIGIILVLLFMLIVYRLPGLVANIALSIYVIMVLGTLALIGATLTLPGIAALILSVGMAVDANVIIFERLKEELKAGKTIRASIDAGFKRATRTILDSNITTLIAGVVLYQFGTGPIKGFATTLIIGIIASMFTAVIITKFLLKLFVGMDLTKNNKLFGA